MENLMPIQIAINLSSIGSDCFRLIQQFNDWKTIIRMVRTNKRNYIDTNHIATKHLNVISLNLTDKFACKQFCHMRISMSIPKLKLRIISYENLSIFNLIIQHVPRLKILDLSSNQIGDKGAEAIAIGLSSVPMLPFLCFRPFLFILIRS